MSNATAWDEKEIMVDMLQDYLGLPKPSHTFQSIFIELLILIACNINGL